MGACYSNKVAPYAPGPSTPSNAFKESKGDKGEVSGANSNRPEKKIKAGAGKAPERVERAVESERSACPTTENLLKYDGPAESEVTSPSCMAPPSSQAIRQRFKCGASLLIPAKTMDAVKAKDLHFTMEVVQPRCPLPAGVQLISPVVQLGPAGIEFPEAVQLFMPLQILACKDHSSNFEFAVLEEGDTEWKKVDGGSFADGQGQVSVKRFCQMSSWMKIVDALTLFSLSSNDAQATVSSYVVPEAIEPGVYTGYTLFTVDGCKACRDKEDGWVKLTEDAAGQPMNRLGRQVVLPKTCEIERLEMKCQRKGDFDSAEFAFNPGSMTIMRLNLRFSGDGKMRTVLSYDLNALASASAKGARIAVVDFLVPKIDSALVIVPIDKPKGCDALYKSVEEAINIGRQVPSCVVKTGFKTIDFNKSLDKKPDMLFFCCHREEDKILLGKSELSNEELLGIFRDRSESGKHNPRFVIFSTCGGETEEQGSELPQALVNAKVGINLVVYWLGQAPDKVAAAYSSTLVECLKQEPLTPEPETRYLKSHQKALDKLKEKYAGDATRIRCFPDPTVPSETPQSDTALGKTATSSASPASGSPGPSRDKPDKSNSSKAQ